LASLSEISKLGWNNYFEAVLTKQGGEQLAKPKTVYIFLKEKQLIIKEYYLKIIPHRLVRHAGRKKFVLLRTRFSFTGTDNRYSTVRYIYLNGAKAGTGYV
jgi:hypothetical protein